MAFWIIIAGLVLGIGAILGRVLMRGRVGDAPPAAYDLQVYRDQLKEVDRDLARGVIGAEEAGRVRTEVSRRILAADAQLREGGETGGQPRAAGLAVALLAAALIGGGAVALYTRLGAPGYADLPLEARIAASDAARASRLSQAEAEAMADLSLPETGVSQEFLDLMEKLRQTVAERPGDLRGLTLLARNEAALGNLVAAHEAQARVVEIKGPRASADDYTFLADLMVTAAGGQVSKEAEAALRAALQRDPAHQTARYYMGLYLVQVDRPDAAFRTWERLLRESPPEAPWVMPIRSQLEQVARRAGVTYQLPPLAALPGPDAGDVAAADDMTGEDRMEMIRGMVARLSDRLATEGGTPQEWGRLIHAYGVLGEADRAALIWAEAREVFAGQPEALAHIRERALQAGLPE